MNTGPGKYDDLCTLVRRRSNASAVVLIVLGGDKGSGFSLQGLEESPGVLAALMPDMMRGIADEIEQSRAQA